MTLIVPVDVNANTLRDWGRKVANALNRLATAPGGGGTTTEDLTFNNGGAGAASGAAFDGSAPITVSYNTVGAAASSHNHNASYLQIANNLSDLANAGTARTNLGVAIGTNVQAFDADLSALAANSTSGLWAITGAGTGAARTITPGTGISVTNGDGVSGNPTIAVSMSPAMTLISEQSPSGASVTFAAIPATYRDLLLVLRGRGDTAATSVQVRLNFNNDTASNYDRIRSGGTNTTSSTAVANEAFAFIGTVPAASATANVPGYCEALIADYRGTTFQKQWQGSYGARAGTANTDLTTNIVHGRWASTSAITEIDVVASAGTFAAGTVVSLYGRM